MSELDFQDLVEAAARATINERCARAYLHDVRGTLQAVYSAVELLGRAAKSGGDNRLRVEKACDLAKRAVGNHEKALLEMMQQLTVSHLMAATVNFSALFEDVVLFLRNDASHKDIKVLTTCAADVSITADRSTLYVLLVGLMTTAIDDAPTGSELRLSLTRQHEHAVLSIESDFHAEHRDFPEVWRDSDTTYQPGDLTLLFARQYAARHGGNLDFDRTSPGHGKLNLRFPLVSPRPAEHSSV